MKCQQLKIEEKNGMKFFCCVEHAEEYAQKKNNKNKKISKSDQ
jgi:hypothetical protein